MIPQDAALQLQLAAIAGNEPTSSFLEIRPLTPSGQPAPSKRAFIPVRQALRAGRVIGLLADQLNVYVGAAPRVRQDGTAAAVERCWTLWTDLDTPEAVERLLRFSPLPSIVIRTGSGGAHAYWPLKQPVAPHWAQRANRRLAAALTGDMAATDPARILRAAGSLNHKHDPPREVTCTRLELDVFTLDQVVGELPDSHHYTTRAVPQLRTGDPAAALVGLARTVATAPVGNRNAALYWAACRVREHDQVDKGSAAGVLRAAAVRAGLTEAEIDRTLHSALQSAQAAA